MFDFASLQRLNLELQAIADTNIFIIFIKKKCLVSFRYVDELQSHVTCLLLLFVFDQMI